MSAEHDAIRRNVSAALDPEFESVLEERIYSMEQWDPDEFDSKNTLNDWVTYISIYAGEAAKMARRDDPTAIYGKLIKAANLALLAAARVREGTIAPRHYDSFARASTPITGNLSA